MAWYNPFSKKPVETEEKLNPAQYLDAGNVESSRENTISYERAYEESRNCKSRSKHDCR